MCPPVLPACLAGPLVAIVLGSYLSGQYMRASGRYRLAPILGSIVAATAAALMAIKLNDMGFAALFAMASVIGRIHPFCTPGKGLDLFWRRVMLPLLGAAVAASSSRAIIRRSALLDGQAVLPRRRRARLEGRHRSFYKFRSA